MANQNLTTLLSEIDAKGAAIEDLALRIWACPELAHKETNASEWTAQLLESEGFEVVRGYMGLPTAIKATWGKGSPTIGFLGEYDALPGMSQFVSTSKEAIQEGEPGEACGHNLIAGAHVGAVMGLKKALAESGLEGTVIFYGCPAEEVVTGKPLMARDGGFRESDMALHWHGGARNKLSVGTMIALSSAKFHFTGITAHAGGDPQNGRSALDAAELMNVGANFLREHVTSDTRIHYILTESGTAPNIVPDRACTYYFVRAMSREAVNDTYERLIKVAKGAAMMTETQVEVEYLGGCYNTLANRVLAEEALAAINEVGFPEYTPEEIDFAQKLNEQSPSYKKMLADGLVEPNEAIDTRIPPIVKEDGFGSTDVGDVMHIIPTFMISTASANIAAPGHSWQITSCAGHSIGIKGMLNAAKILGATALRVFEDPTIVQKAKEEFDASMKGKTYVCPVTEDFTIA